MSKLPPSYIPLVMPLLTSLPATQKASIVQGLEQHEAVRNIVIDARTNQQRSAWAKSRSVNDWITDIGKEAVEALAEPFNPEKAHELGDVLWNTLSAIIASENNGGPSLTDVIRTVNAKIRSRKPHIFDGSDTVLTAEQEQEFWLKQKAAEKADKDIE